MTDNQLFKRLAGVAAALSLPVVGAAAPADAAGRHNHPPLAATALTVGDRTAPVDVTGSPLFGWQPHDADGGEVQTAYRIRVVDGADPARTVWDSGKVDSDQTAYVPYGGPALSGDATYRWTVRTWDRAGAASPWARPASFGTGIGDAEWQAWWIRRTTAERDDYTLARREFTVGASRVVRARLYVSAAQQYRAYLNGELIDRGQAFAYPDEGYYQATDVTGALRAGRPATLGILYHWYGPGQGRPAGQPGMLARLVIDHSDGSRQVVVSDGAWRMTRGPWLPAAYRNDDGRDYIEHIDGRIARQQQGWSRPGFDDSAWQPAQALGAHPTGVFTALRPQQTRLTYRDVRPVSVTTLASGAVVADFGKVIAATPRVRFAAGVAGREVAMAAGYLLNPDGSVNTSARDNQSTNLSYRYVQHDGAQTFQAFTYEAFRYLQVAGPVADLTAELQHTALDPRRTATFHSSDATLDAVFDLTRRSALFSAQEQFLDTPTREKGQFLADAANISRALMAGSGDRELTARAIREFLASQRRYWPDGRVNAVYPNGDGRRDIPDFTELLPGWVWSYYLHSGDLGLLADAYPAVRAIADYVRRYRDPGTGLVTNLAGGSGPYQYGIIDWPNRYGYDTSTAARTTVNILAVDVLRSTARQAEVLGRPQGEIDTLHADADALTAAVNTRLRRPDGVYRDGLAADGTPSGHASQIANAYAIAFGIIPPETARAVVDHLVALKLRMGPMTAGWLLTALHRVGRDDQVLARLTDAESLGWANVLARGGTFTWESWEAPETGESMSHGWGATALVDIQEALLGVTVTAPAARALRIAPPRGTALTHARGTLWTQAGTVAVSWRTARGGTAVSVDLPVNVTARVEVPVAGGAAPRATGTAPPRLEGIANGIATYTVGSGHSTFTPAGEGR
jgi:alpha-L-rhamnosidase